MRNNKMISGEFLSKLHDFEICGILIARARKGVEIQFSGDSDEKYSIVMDEISYININHVMVQNVVYSAVLSGVSKISDYSLNKMVSWALSMGDIVVREDMVESYTSKIKSGEVVLFYIEPSIGAEVGIIAKSAALSTDMELPQSERATAP